MSAGVMLFLWIFWMVVLWVAYHKIFEVYYFNLGNGLMKEFLGTMFGGFLMTALTLYFWWVAAIIIILVGLSAMKKMDSKAPLVFAIIGAIIIAFVGIDYKNSMNENNVETSSIIGNLYEI